MNNYYSKNNYFIALIIIDTSLGIFLQTLQLALSDPGFKVQSLLAAQALQCAKLLLCWCSKPENELAVSTFATTIYVLHKTISMMIAKV